MFQTFPHHIPFPGGQVHKGLRELAGEEEEHMTDEKLTLFCSHPLLIFIIKFQYLIPAKAQQADNQIQPSYLFSVFTGPDSLAN